MDYLSSSVLDLNFLNEYYLKDLENIFSKAAKPSLIIWDYKTKLQVYSIYSSETLFKNKIMNKTWYEIDELKTGQTWKSIIFFIESKLKQIELTESIVKRKLAPEHHLVFVPQALTCHMDYMEKKGIDKNYQTISSFKCYGIPLDYDIISLENPEFILEMSDINVLYQLARTLIIIQNIYGVIPKISGKGERVKDLIRIIQNNQAVSTDNVKEMKISHLLVFDRRIDMLTPLLSQITYESLLDEVFHITAGHAAVPSFMMTENVNKSDVSLFQVNSADSFFAEIRDAPIYDALTKIIEYSHEVKAEREKYLKAKKMDELAEVTRNLKSFLTREANAQFHLTMGMSLNKYTKLSNHTDFVKYQSMFLSQEDLDKPHPYVEDSLLKKLDIEKVIQLICIQCLCAGGLKLKLLNHYKKEIIRTYGLAYSGVLSRLEKMRLLFAQSTSNMMRLGETSFDSITHQLNLLPESDYLCNTYAGFVPICTRLAQYYLKPGWTTLSKGLDCLPDHEPVHLNNTSPRADLDGILSCAAKSLDDRKVVLVCFIGGITRSEISTLRLLSQHEDSSTSYVILTTGIINLPMYLESLARPMEKKQPINPF